MKKIAICAPKGGAGKTTTMLALAVHAQQKKKRVAIFDFNSDQENVPDWLEARKGAAPTLIDFQNPLKDAKAIADDFDFLFSDTPPVVDDDQLVEAAVAISDFVVIPVRPSMLDIGTMPDMVRICRERKRPFSFLLCDVTSSWKSLNQKAAEALSDMGPLFKARMTHRMAYVNAITIGKTGAEIDTDCREEVAAIWTELLAKMEAANG